MIVFNHLPVDPLRVTSKFGKRNTGIQGASTFHEGIDLGRDFSKGETPVLAVAAGTVSKNYWNDTRGWVIVINHNGFQTLYQHLKNQSTVQIGTNVIAGQQIGVMGASTKTIKGMEMHLHMELLVDGVQMDPLPYLQHIEEVKDLTREETVALIKEVLAGSGDTPSPWAKEVWEEGTKEGLIKGSNPKGYVTREEVITIIKRALK